MKLLYTFVRESWEDNWCGYKDRFGVRSTILCETYYGLFDDGTWEPLYRYCPWDDKIVFQNIKGVKNTTIEYLTEVLEKIYYSGEHKTMQLLIGKH